MIVAMLHEATEEHIQHVIERMVELGFNVHRTTGAAQTILAGVGTPDHFEVAEFKVLAGVHDAYRISSPYKLAGKSFRPEGTTVKFSNGVVVGGKEVTIMAGPCSVESREQILLSAKQVKAAGAQFLRGGAYKPRSSPYSFQGMGVEGLKLLREVADETGLLVITEVMEISQIEVMLPYIDCFQVGARNMQNFNLLRELGHVRKPVLMKRGIAATIEEVLLSAEYILSGGNYDLMLCERGIRTYETYTRNTMDISAIPVLKKLTHLPVFGDPSHGIGIRDLVPPMALASVAAGADGLLMEMHPDPNKAMSDGAQSLYPEQLEKLIAQRCGSWLRVVGRTVAKTRPRDIGLRGPEIGEFCLIERILIVGTGLIGSSIGLALREAGYKGQIHGFDENLSELELALSTKAIDDFAFGLEPRRWRSLCSGRCANCAGGAGVGGSGLDGPAAGSVSWDR